MDAAPSSGRRNALVPWKLPMEAWRQDQNLMPAPTRALYVDTTMFSTGANCTNSNSPRRKIFCVRATSMPPPIVKPYMSSKLCPTELENAKGEQGGVEVVRHAPAAGGF